MLVNGEGIIAGHGFTEHQSLNCVLAGGIRWRGNGGEGDGGA